MTTSSDAPLALLPRRAAAEVITTAISHGGRAVGVVYAVTAIPLVVDVLGGRDASAQIGFAVAAAAIVAALLLLGAVVPWRSFIAVGIVGCVVGVVVYTLVVGRAASDLGTDATFLVDRLALVLIVVGPRVRRPVAGILWATGGLLACFAVLVGVGMVVASAWELAAGTLVTWGVYAAAFLVVGLVGAASRRRVPDLARLARETRRHALESEFEQRAGAMIHDTVLGDLSAIMNGPERLDDRTRQRLLADVALLRDPTWLAGEQVDPDEGDAELRTGLTALVTEMQWAGLNVDISGAPHAVVRLPPAARAALLEAVRQCLQNVLKHSGQASAEIIFDGDEHELTALVVDEGVGFDPDAVGDDHLGLRASVIGRIEQHGGRVRIFSRRGAGTSVSIALPLDAVGDTETATGSDAGATIARERRS